MPASKENLSYRDIKKIVLDRIQSRIWLPDSLLPSETDLAEEFSSTRTTVNRALRELASEGYIERKRKAGTRVLNSPIRKAQFAIPLISDEVTSAGAEYAYSLVSRTQCTAPGWLSARLRLSQPADVLHVRCMHYSDGKPFQFEDRWIVIASVPDVGVESFEKIGPNAWLVQKVPFTDVELSFMATKTNSELSEFLDAPLGEPVFTTERITWLGEIPVTFARLYFTPGYRMTTQF